jgi:diadenosine tetraphosphate (Ap4A) HIT family hydrolase
MNIHRIIGECEQTITFIDNYPASPGHTLVIPKRHFATYFEATITFVSWNNMHMQMHYTLPCH